ncbi:autotransporter outer membrane beta-barrel domain-containing protein [Sphingomonas sp. RP10(2022)]|uniref:Autotransporter outer membrane beta-barrel domain-containing protein n=1 Tax=Sphingomonas liriopis TaxID=2949094 RepID=A0A9X2KUL8_9SPHN|nr:autotransporter outer membrane beta-barrel domain-containing protein [Sphingomonas liriopis]MCP3736123.1 autotransporter outer membrane beta-barrel domain-containing protein [Sphingomonas liriopis]
MTDHVFRGAARRALLASTALIALPAVAQAQVAPTGVENIAHGNPLLAISGLETIGQGERPVFADNIAQGVTLGALANLDEKVAQNRALPLSALQQENQPNIVIRQPGTSTTSLDTGTSVNGVGNMTIAYADGLGICTGTLINPRTVIFAAHCVNENGAGTGAQDPWQYGSAGGGIPIAFGFQANNLPAVRDWYLATTSTGAVNPNQFKTNTANFLYNVNQVVYNADSLKLGLAQNFIQADIAIATLDTPAANVPTWALLFSALPAPATISDTTGTGYHVTITGYGRSGTATTTTGDTVGIDYRRRIAENTIGILGSFNDRDTFLFGSTSNLPQNLYQLDMDDPRRGTATKSPYDFNLFKDNALPNEGTTAGGDSGGPLILDRAFAKQVVIGVLSGGSRFYGAQPFGSYGTESFYQPLYLFWDYIVANNPYRYAQTKAGDGLWTDASRWVTALDPNYQVIVNGQLANGVPTTTGAGIAGDANKFGKVCFETATVSDCQDIKTGIEYINGQPVAGTGNVASVSAEAIAARDAAIAESATTAAAPATASATGGGRGAGMSVEDIGQDGRTDASLLVGGENVAQAGDAIAAVTPTPAATPANGLPGATNFVPNNVDPNRVAKTAARYYDVSLTAAGTTTLNTAVTIDRFTVAGSTAKLAVTSGGSLTSLMGVTQVTGVVDNNGVINSRGDYMNLGGMITGTGRINAPFLTNVSGMIAPGTTGTIGTLTVGGNLVLASASTLLIDVGPNGTSDSVAVVRNGTTDGLANIGGRVGFAAVAGHTIRYNDVYTILTAAGGISGTFQAPAAISAILSPQFIYSTNAVQARIIAGTYASVVANTPIQTAFAGLLDRNRAANYGNLSGLYGILDIQNAATIQSTLEGLAPRTTPLKYGMGTVATENMSRFYRQHLAGIDASQPLSGTLTMTGQPLQFASLMASDLPTSQATASDTTSTTVREGVLPENVAVFIAGGYIDGDSRSLRDALPFGGRDNFDGFYVASGIEAKAGDNGVIGFGLSYTKLDGTTGGVAQTARGELYQGTLFVKAQSLTGQVLDAQVSGGVFQARTNRNVSIAGNASNLRSRDNALAISAEVGAAQMFDVGGFQIGPRIAGRINRIDFTPTLETGGNGALRFDRYQLASYQGRAGLQIAGGQVLKPFASAYFVHDFKDQPGVFTANFIGGTAPAGFRLSSQDQNWGEIAAGLSYSGERFELSLSADTTIERNDVRNQAYRGAVKFKF